MQVTSRDAQIVAWLGRLGAAGAQHVSERFGICLSWTHKRLTLLTADGLLAHRRVLHLRPGLYSATKKGLRWHGLYGLPIFEVSPGGFEHAWQMAGIAVALHRQLPDWQVLAEREIRLLHIQRKQLVGWAMVGRPGSHRAYHRPDFALISPSGRVVVVEVELTPKGRRRLELICRGWTRARHVEHVYYLASRGVAPQVKQAAEAVRATDVITILDLDDVSGLAALEKAHDGRAA